MSNLTPINKLPNIEGRSIVLDTETSGLNYMEDKPFLLGIKTKDDNKNYGIHWTPDLTDWLNRELSKADKVEGFNLKYDFHMLVQGGVNLDVVMDINPHDHMLAEVLMDENQDSYSLDNLGIKWLGHGKTSQEFYEFLASIFGGIISKKQMNNMGKFSRMFDEDPHGLAPRILPYLFGDLDTTSELSDVRSPGIIDQGLDVVYALEMETVRSLVMVEREGIPVDREALDAAIIKFGELFEASKLKTEEMVGRPTNVMSSPALITAFQRLGLEIPKEGGKITFDKAHMSAVDHPFAAQVLYERSIRKANEAFGKGFLPYIGRDGRIHTNFNQMKGDEYGTITGRLSCSNPNMQQIPKRDADLCRYLRSVFVAPEGYEWVSADWSQFEFRVFAHYANDEQLINTFINDPTIDYHQALTDIINDPRLPRGLVKRINLGLVFGMGGGKLAMECKLPYSATHNRNGKKVLVPGEEAKSLFAGYHGRLPAIKRTLDRASALARQRGYVKTITGRRIRFPNPGKSYKAGGVVFQGTSADIMKAKKNEIIRRFRGTDVKLILLVHDEFDLLAPKEQAKEVAKEVKEILQTVPQLRVPILSEVGIGPNWYESGENQI